MHSQNTLLRLVDDEVDLLLSVKAIRHGIRQDGVDSTSVVAEVMVSITAQR
jgi:hypothetical protein